MDVRIVRIEQEPDGDGLVVYGMVDGRALTAHAWRSHLYANHAVHDAARRNSKWYSEGFCEVCEGNGTTEPETQEACERCDGTGYEPVEPQLLPADARLETDEQRRAYLAGLLVEASGKQLESLDHLLGQVESPA